MKFLKKNQIVIYVIAFMLVTAGYLNYTTYNSNSAIQTSSTEEELAQMANIGDAQLVSSNAVKDTNNTADETSNRTNTTSTINNTTKTETNIISENKTVTTNADNQTEPVDEYFTKSKLERDTMYSQMLETYEKVLNSSNSLETQKQAATQEITKINETKNSIMICENLIGTKGFENNIIFVNGESVSVIIGKKEIKQEEIAQIQNIIARELKAKIENIHIATK